MITLENAVIEYNSKKFVVDEEDGCCYYRRRNGDIFMVPLDAMFGLPNDDERVTTNVDDFDFIEFQQEDILDLKDRVNMVLDANNKNR